MKARDLIDGLTYLVSDLPDGLDSDVRLGICDSADVQMVDLWDVVQQFPVNEDGSPRAAAYVLLRGHIHPGDHAGEVLRGVAADADDELRRLTDEDPPPS